MGQQMQVYFGQCTLKNVDGDWTKVYVASFFPIPIINTPSVRASRLQRRIWWLPVTTVSVIEDVCQGKWHLSKTALSGSVKTAKNYLHL